MSKGIEELLQVITKILDERQAEDILSIDVSKNTVLADFFVLASGTSSRHVRALSDEVQRAVSEKLQREPKHVEGKDNDHWILIDYLDVVVHIFDRESRSLYSLERLWQGK
ncbi:MAG: ribosome silencing factor [Clostridiaceae bacterium]|nr:ribosome silencing factor [Clostridiaceae bacterium]